jgi:hypothetical protein
MLYKIRTLLGVAAARRRARGAASPEAVQACTRFVELHLFDGMPVHAAYHPDDYVTHRRHGEFAALQQRFLAHNRANNAGDLGRLWALVLNIKDVVERGIPGDFAELGVWRGNTAAVLAHYAAGRNVYLFDTFTGFDRRDLVGVDARQAAQFADTSLDLVRQNVADPSGGCRYVQGRFPGSLGPEHLAARYAVVSLDCDLHEPMAAALDVFYPRLTEGGIMFIHDYANHYWPGIRAAVDAFCRPRGLYPVLLPDKSGSAVLRKAGGG